MFDCRPRGGSVSHVVLLHGAAHVTCSLVTWQRGYEPVVMGKKKKKQLTDTAQQIDDIELKESNQVVVVEQP